MFIRFISEEIDEDSHLSAGLFGAAYKLIDEVCLPEYDYEALRETMDWFNEHLENPYDFRPEPEGLAYQSICWFRATAREYLHRAWEMVAILEEHDIFVRTVKSHRPGYILYEDEAQVLAHPYADIRRFL
jgi:hypothetical protein